MNNAIKGAVLSGLVLPGLGQIVQKNYMRGTALILIVSWSLFQILVKMLRQVSEVLEQIRTHGIVISTDDFLNVVMELMPDVGGPSYQTLTFFVTGCWLLSTVDAYLVGSKMDAAENATPPDLSGSIELE